jgi:hypothetical protein
MREKKRWVTELVIYEVFAAVRVKVTAFRKVM